MVIAYVYACACVRVYVSVCVRVHLIIAINDAELFLMDGVVQTCNSRGRKELTRSRVVEPGVGDHKEPPNPCTNTKIDGKE